MLQNPIDLKVIGQLNQEGCYIHVEHFVADVDLLSQICVELYGATDERTLLAKDVSDYVVTACDEEDSGLFEACRAVIPHSELNQRRHSILQKHYPAYQLTTVTDVAPLVVPLAQQVIFPKQSKLKETGEVDALVLRDLLDEMGHVVEKDVAVLYQLYVQLENVIRAHLRDKSKTACMEEMLIVLRS